MIREEDQDSVQMMNANVADVLDAVAAPSHPGDGIVFVSDADARALLEWPAMIDAIRRIYAVPHSADVSPPRVMARAPGIWMRTLTGLDPTGRFMGVKQFGLSRQRRLQYLISLFDQETGRIVALLDAGSVTAFRTAATTAVALDRMARPGAATLGMVGSGGEAYTHARAIHAVRPLARLTVFSRNPERRAAFASAFEAETGVSSVAVDSAEAAVRGQDMVIGATNATGTIPIIRGEWLCPDAVLASIGATLPEQCEVDVTVLDQAGLIVADVPEEVLDTGCSRAAAARGVALEGKIVTLNALVLGQLDARLRECRYPVYRSVGGPLQDIAIATLAFERAVATGAARSLPISFTTK